MSSSATTAAPLLRPRQPPSSPLSLLLSRAAAATTQRRGGASMLVRETAARELEVRRANWGYSKPVVALDMMWNLAFVIVSVVMLICTLDEDPIMPIRVWVCGYALQCLVHVVLVWIEYKRRNSRHARVDGGEEVNHSDNESEDGDVTITRSSSTVKRCESMNTMASFIWWIVGFYWVISGGEILLRSAPRLYWLAVVFLAFDVFFAIFCVVLACLIGIALCCCLPCIIAILYAIAGQEGASEADLNILPKYRFEVCKDEEWAAGHGAGRMIPMEISSGYMANERILLAEDAECSICLCAYEDGVELHALPCSHHFHAPCIVKWLKMNATCPLCKYNILKGNDQV